MSSTKELALTTTSRMARYLIGLPGPVVLHRYSCTGCPLNMLCLGGYNLGDQFRLEPESWDTPSNGGVCKRCWCLYFEIKKTMHVCARARDGVFTRLCSTDTLRHPSKEYVFSAVAGDRYAMSYNIPFMCYGCAAPCEENKGTIRTIIHDRWNPEHPRNLSENEREYLDESDSHAREYRDDSISVDPRDCVDFIRVEAPHGVVEL